ncbi:hypothetical protein Igni_0865 [Ignicoccus hospitalis KIN4/I]|uniref:Uncharacterized protein n=1 Tax=Ignicoccus hospitalis (strain KIN4/I / DSM 18386 / JCM 14125) TaxID=453591 RepID=A8AAU5_IGNH4|nr:hypothetical protein Igni_0865 [Ignicoccus hospitalis KIN4/I]
MAAVVKNLLLRAGKRTRLLVVEGALVVALSPSVRAQGAQPLEDLLARVRLLPKLIIEWRDQLISWVRQNDLYLFMSVLAVPLLVVMYYDGKLLFRELRDLTIYILRRKELLPIEKRWYVWRMSMRAVGIVALTLIIVLMAGVLAWMAQFEHLSDMFAALEKMRREENLLGILQKFVSSLRRR